MRAFSYDAAGNILSDGNGGSAYTAVYKHEGRLAELSSGSLVMKLAYDAQGQRFRKQIGSNPAVYFAYDLQGQLLGEYTLSGSTFKPLMEYIWLEGQPVAAVRPTPGAPANAPNSAQEVFYLHTDHLGTPRVALDTAGRVRWRWMDGEPFGLSPAETNPNGLGELNISLRLPGQQFDGFVGLHYNYFRDYDPTTGRYVQSDPIGLAGGSIPTVMRLISRRSTPILMAESCLRLQQRAQRTRPRALPPQLVQRLLCKQQRTLRGIGGATERLDQAGPVGRRTIRRAIVLALKTAIVTHATSSASICSLPRPETYRPLNTARAIADAKEL